MDYVEGVPIPDSCARGGSDLHAVLGALHPGLQAVASAHRQLVVALRPQAGNVLVTPEGAARLLDFGIARLSGSGAETLHDVVTGPRAASPEQRRGAKPGIPSDIYSLGPHARRDMPLAGAAGAGAHPGVARHRRPRDRPTTPSAAIRPPSRWRGPAAFR